MRHAVRWIYCMSNDLLVSRRLRGCEAATSDAECRNGDSVTLSGLSSYGVCVQCGTFSS